MKKILVVILMVIFTSSLMFGVSCTKESVSTEETIAAEETSSTSIEETPSTSEEVVSEKKPTVGIVVKVLTGNSFQIDLGDYAKKAAEELGFEATVLAPQTFEAYQEQISIIEDFITKKVSFIVVAPSSPTAIIPVIEKAKTAGIPVIVMDGELEGTDVPIATIATDNVNAAYMGTKWLCEKIGGKGKIVHLEGESGNIVGELRKEGMLKALEEYPDVELVVSQNAHWTEEGGLQVMENALQSNPDIVGVFSANDNAAIGAIEAVKAAGVDPVIVGYDAIPEALELIKSGELDATVAQFPQVMAETAVRIGAAYLEYFKDNVPIDVFMKMIDSGAAVVTVENVDEFLK